LSFCLFVTDNYNKNRNNNNNNKTTSTTTKYLQIFNVSFDSGQLSIQTQCFVLDGLLLLVPRQHDLKLKKKYLSDVSEVARSLRSL
jgi:hypothetical protein